MKTEIFATNEGMGQAAALAVAAKLREILAQRETARFVIATGTSQLSYVSFLVRECPLPWDRIECFHMDEYVGASADHPASFRRWLRERVDEVVHPRVCHYVQAEASDVGAECDRYAALLRAAPIDVISLGIGENGYIAFNDPSVADFNDPAAAKIVELEEACKRQQVAKAVSRT